MDRHCFTRHPQTSPIRTFDQIGDGCYHAINSLVGARVFFRNTAALAADFPGIDTAPEALDQFLIKSCAIISVPQCSANVVNAAIPVLPDSRRAFRPPNYGRACIVEAAATCGGLIDVKGCGVTPTVVPDNRPYRTGLLPLYDAVVELLMQRIVDCALIAAKPQSDVITLPVYALLNAGFVGRAGGTATVPMALIARRAHRRLPKGYDLPLPNSPRYRLTLATERILRQSGVTSANSAGMLLIATKNGRTRILRHGEDITEAFTPTAVERITNAGATDEFCMDITNVQFSCDPEASTVETLVDFGQYEVRGAFDHVLCGTHALWPITGAAVTCKPGHFAFPMIKNTTIIDLFSGHFTLRRAVTNYFGWRDGVKVQKLRCIAAILAWQLSLGDIAPDEFQDLVFRFSFNDLLKYNADIC